MKKKIGLSLICAVSILAFSCAGKGNSAKGLEMVKVAGNTFETVYKQKYSYDYKDDQDSKPHLVTLSDFEIAKTETTYKTWYDVYKWATDEAREDKRYRFTNSGREGNGGIDGAEPTIKSNHPVTCISWFNAIIWCNALSEKTGLEPVYYFDGQIARDVRKIENLDYEIFGSSRKVNGMVDEDAVKRKKEKFPELHFEQPKLKYSWNGDAVYEDDYGRLEETDENYQPLLNILTGEYCELQEHLKIDASKNGYRLPTSLEWVYAAKGGKPGSYEWEMKYSGSDTASEVGWFSGECGYDTNIGEMNEFLPEYGTKPVATKKANGLGIYDMSGNVGELTGSYFLQYDNDIWGFSGHLEINVEPSSWKNKSYLLQDGIDLLSRSLSYKTGNNTLGFRVARNAQ